MKTPFTGEQFSEVFRIYNEAVFPMQVLLVILAVFTLYLSIKPTAASGKIISGILGFLWLYMGIVYHLRFFADINAAAYLFGGLFILQGILFFAAGVFQNKLFFEFRPDKYGLTGISLVFFALILYPALGYALGHVYPEAPGFGLPCPTTIFTFGVLLFCNKKLPLTLTIIPFIWSVVGFTAAFQFGMLEDTALLIAGLVTVPMLLIKNKSQ